MLMAERFMWDRQTMEMYFYALINLDGVNALLNTKNISRYEFEEMLKNFTR